MNPHSDIPLLVTAPPRQAGRADEPVTMGVPLPRGLARDAQEWTLRTADGVLLPVQTAATDRWPDGSIRWLLVDSQINVPAGETKIRLLLRPEAATATTGCVVERASSGLVIDSGAYRFRLSARAPAVIESVEREGVRIYDGGAADVRIVGQSGEQWRVEWQDTQVEASGPLRVATLTPGTATNSNGGKLALFLRFEFFHRRATVRLRLTIRNPRRAAHPGGIWELGDAASLLLKEFSLVMPFGSPDTAKLMMAVEGGPWVEAYRRVRVYQESSGGEDWSSPNHRNRDGHVALRFPGYRVEVDGVEAAGRRATPAVAITEPNATLGVAIPYFWQNFPRALEVTPAELRVSFFPPEAPDFHELQGGEQKTHECFVTFDRDSISDTPPDWCRARAVLHAPPDWYARSRAIPNFVTAHDEEPAYRAIVNNALDGPDTFLQKREVADEYGWRHFGDIYGDHEAVRNTSPAPLISHYNNQYDPVAGFFYQFASTGDVRWWEHCVELASHVIDIDIYHTNEDKSAYNHGLFWHTIHYIDAGKATHRSYPSGTIGGGPSSEHNYPTGLMLLYFATGDQIAREAAEGLCRFVIDIDDGSKTIFRFVDRGHTGIASASRTPDYHGPGRGPGNSLNALVDGHRLTGDHRFLDKAEQLIRRCTHPRQDVERLTLLDPENRWFYTMYLQSLGKYLQWKEELGTLDAMYAYGRDVLLHFARWMANQERPYLSRPDLLEFPTETWAAQDIRKSEVFDHAARHASVEEAARFIERAEFFFRYSVDTLTTMPTRTLARPMVLMLGHGMLRAHTRTHGITAAPPPREDWSARWPAPEAFVPQKTRAMRRARVIAIAGAAALVGAAALIAIRLL